MAATARMYQQPLQGNMHNGFVDQVPFGQPNYLTGVFCRALYDYDSTDASSLSFRRGDIIEVLTRLESGWWDGLLNDERGWFPSNYVAIMSEQELEQEDLLRVGSIEHQGQEWVQEVRQEVSGPTSDFWVPRVHPSGRIFYVNTQTGEQSNELPTDAAIDSDVEPLMNVTVNNRSDSTTTVSSTAYSSVSSAPTTVAGGDSQAGFGLPKRSGTPEPWVKRLADDGMSYYYYNTADGTSRWTAPSPTHGARQPAPAPAYANGRARAESAATRQADRLSVYSDDSDVNPLGILGRAAAHAHTASQTVVNEPIPRSQLDEAPELTTAKVLQSSLEERFPLVPDSLDDLAEAARAAIADLVDIALARNNTSLIKDAIKRTTDSVRNLIYASSTLIGPMNALPRPYASTTGFTDTAELKTFHRKVTASMVKLVTAIRASMGSDIVSPDMSARFENDATELGRAITTFVEEVLQRRPADDSARLVRAVLHSESGSRGVGSDLFGAGAAGSWKGFGFVGSVTGKPLSAEMLDNIQQHRDNVDSVLGMLESIIPTGEVSDVTQIGRQALQRLVLFLGLVADMNVASTLDVDSENMDAAYTQSVNRAKELLRSLEFSVQAAFEDGAVLLNMIQSANSRSPIWKVFAMAVPALRGNISDVCSHITELTQISQSQSDACSQSGLPGMIGVRNASKYPGRSDRDTIVYSPDNNNMGGAEGEEDMVQFGDVLGGSSWGERDTGRTTDAGVYARFGREDSNPELEKPTPGQAPDVNGRGRGYSDTGALSDDPSKTLSPVAEVPMPNGSGSSTGTDTLLGDDDDDDLDDEILGRPSRTPKRSARAIKIKDLLGPDAPDAYIQNANADDKPWYLRAEHGPEEIWLNPEGGVRGGTLPALIERLTSHDNRDNGFNSTFLLTYKSFTTLNELFDGLVKRFYIKAPDGLKAEELQEWSTKKQQVVRFRVINIMKSMLTDENFLEKEDMYILERIKEFAATVDREITPPIPAARQLADLVDRAQNGTDAMIKRMQMVPAYTPAPLIPKSTKQLKLVDIDPLELARQLTIMENKLFSKIRPMECLNRGRDVKPSDSDDNISAIIDTSNKVAEWVADVILSKDDSKKRANMIKQFIAVADRCRLLQNFSTMAALVAGLNSPPIRRLKRTWDQVNQRSKTQLQEAERTMDTNKNFTNYRAILKAAQLPCVPFFGVYLSVLTFIQDGNKNLIKGDLVNFSKREKFAEVVREIQHYQSKPYNLTPIPAIQDFINEQLSALGNSADVSDRAWNLSLEREPREREDEKMARLLQESGFI